MSKIKHILLALLFSFWTSIIFFGGYLMGAQEAGKLISNSQAQVSSQEPAASPSPSPAAVITKTPQTKTGRANYSGPQLWEAVNKARVEYGVNALKQKDILCTIAAIRLSQIRELGKLDGHEGFRGVYDKYKDDPTVPNNVSEFLISGYPTPNQAVSAWLDTLGHRKLITGGEYVWGCIYAQDGFGVAITGY